MTPFFKTDEYTILILLKPKLYHLLSKVQPLDPESLIVFENLIKYFDEVRFNPLKTKRICFI
jgi:hypothetical protein